jgi:hypothetical protein
VNSVQTSKRAKEGFRAFSDLLIMFKDAEVGQLNVVKGRMQLTTS